MSIGGIALEELLGELRVSMTRPQLLVYRHSLWACNGFEDRGLRFVLDTEYVHIEYEREAQSPFYVRKLECSRESML